MCSRVVRFSAIVAVVALAGGCVDPLATDGDQARLTQQENVRSSSLTASAISANQVDLTWPDNAVNEAGYEVHRSSGAGFTAVASTGANATSYSDLGLAPATQYCYKVRPFKLSGRKTTYSAFSAAACATTLNAVPAASNAAAVPLSSNVVEIRWADNATAEEGFRVQRASTPVGPFVTVATTTPDATSYQDLVSPEQQVCYRIIAFTSGGEAAPSNTACTTPPYAPTNFVARSVDAQTVDLTWTDNSAVEEGYELQRWDESLTAWTIVADLEANASSYRDQGLRPDVTYWYMVRAKKDGGYSSFWNYATAHTASAPPNAPSDAVAFYSFGGFASVAWVDNSSNEEGFSIQRGPSEVGPWVTVGRRGPDESYFAEEGVIAERVCYQVIAFNGRGDSNPSFDCATPPPPPANLVATAVDHQTIDLSWTYNSTAADGFLLLRHAYPFGEFLGSVELPATARSYRDSGLASSTWYWYFVVAINEDGSSDYSNEAIVATPSPGVNQSITAMPRRLSSTVQAVAPPPGLVKALSRPAHPGTTGAAPRGEPTCPLSAPLRHECPKPVLQGGVNP